LSTVPTGGDGPVEVIVLNGASSTGKTTLAASLQDVFDVQYDLVVDTTSRTPHEVAREIAQYVRAPTG